MNRAKFVAAVYSDERPLDRGHYKNVIRGTINSSKDRNLNGTNHLIFCIEELAELQQELSKEMRGSGDFVNILEEVADSLISIGMIQEIIGLSDDLIISAMNTKIDRLENRLERKTNN